MNELEVFLNLVKSPENATLEDMRILEEKLNQYPTYNNIKLAILHALNKTADRPTLEQKIQQFGLHFQHQESLLKHLILTDEQSSANATDTNDVDDSVVKDSPVSTNLEKQQVLDDSEEIENEPEPFSEREHEEEEPIAPIEEAAKALELEKDEGAEIQDKHDKSSKAINSSEDAEQDKPVNKIDIYSINFEELKLHEFHDAQEYADDFLKQKQEEQVEQPDISKQHREELTNTEESVSELTIDETDEPQSNPEPENKEGANSLEIEGLEPEGESVEEELASETQVDDSQEKMSAETSLEEKSEEAFTVEDIEESLIENAPFIVDENQDSQELQPAIDETNVEEEETGVEDIQEDNQFEALEQETVDVDQDDEPDHSKDELETEILDTEPRFSEIKFDLDINSIASSDSEEEPEEEDTEPLPISQKRTFKEWLNPSGGSLGIRQSKDQQEKIIDDFIAKNPGPIRPDFQKDIEPKPSEPTEDDFARIGNMSDLMTETLAKIYLDQKKYNKAIRAYKMLSLKYPEKSSFFASQISEIKKLRAHNGNL